MTYLFNLQYNFKLIGVMYRSSRCHCGFSFFSFFLQRLWITNGIDCSTILLKLGYDMTCFYKKNRRPFLFRIRFTWMERLLFFFELRRLNPRFVACNDFLNVTFELAQFSFLRIARKCQSTRAFCQIALNKSKGLPVYDI